MFLDIGLGYASRVRVAGFWIWSPCCAVSEQVASTPWDGSTCARWSWKFSPTHITVVVEMLSVVVWLFRNAVLGGLRSETELLCV